MADFLSETMQVEDRQTTVIRKGGTETTLHQDGYNQKDSVEKGMEKIQTSSRSWAHNMIKPLRKTSLRYIKVLNTNLNTNQQFDP